MLIDLFQKTRTTSMQMKDSDTLPKEKPQMYAKAVGHSFRHVTMEEISMYVRPVDAMPVCWLGRGYASLRIKIPSAKCLPIFAPVIRWTLRATVKK